MEKLSEYEKLKLSKESNGEILYIPGETSPEARSLYLELAPRRWKGRPRAYCPECEGR